MSENPILEDLMNQNHLRADQAAGALGLVLLQLRKYLQADQFALIQNSLPDCERLMKQAPEVKAGLFGGLANTLGSEKAKALLHLSKGLTRLGIPADMQRELGQTLKESVSRHYPDLVDLIEIK